MKRYHITISWVRRSLPLTTALFQVASGAYEQKMLCYSVASTRNTGLEVSIFIDLVGSPTPPRDMFNAYRYICACSFFVRTLEHTHLNLRIELRGGGS